MGKSMDATPLRLIEPRRRLAAIGALAALAALLIGTIWELSGDGWRLLVGFALVLVTVVACWFAVTRRTVLRWLGLLMRPPASWRSSRRSSPGIEAVC